MVKSDWEFSRNLSCTEMERGVPTVSDWKPPPLSFDTEERRRKNINDDYDKFVRRMSIVNSKLKSVRITCKGNLNKTDLKSLKKAFRMVN